MADRHDAELAALSDAVGTVALNDSPLVESPEAGAAAASAIPPPAAPADTDPTQTAAIVTAGVDLACGEVWGAPLDETEREALVRDLAAVLRKHDVPELPYQEEVALGLTAGGIVWRRVKLKREREQQELRQESEALARDWSSHRQEGEREIHGATAPDMASTARGAAVRDLLA